MRRMVLFAAEARRRSWFWWGLAIGALVGLLVWWWLQLLAEEEEGDVARVDRIVLPEGEDEPDVSLKSDLVAETETLEVADLEQDAADAAEVADAKEAGDDLRRIEGIGPRCAEVLGEAGVTTFERLAGMDPDAIQRLLREAEVRVPYPETWPEQAALAALGNWEALDALQEILQGGRRI